MNKKIFTLLAGAFLMFAMVFSVKAQITPVGHGLWDSTRLSLGNAVPTLQLGMNSGYYHLKIDSVVGRPSTPSVRDSNKILYMGKDVNENLMLFIDSINNARTHFNNYFSAAAPKAEESAAGLWCVNITRYDQGRNIIFDFTNKLHTEMLEIDIYGYESWPAVIPNDPADDASHVSINALPGGVSGWEFSGTFATMLEARPLISYITRDTVAVLCTSVNNNTGGSTADSVYVKIASATDVQNGRVQGVIFFRLMDAAPFIINAEDYNTMFGSSSSTTGGRLKFNPPSTAGENPFSSDLRAEYLTVNYSGVYGTRVDTFNWLPWGTSLNPNPNTPVAGAQNYTTVRYTAESLDSLGYMMFKSGTNQTAQVKREYFPGNVGGHQFLKVELGPNYNAATADSLFFGQYVFRMVYYPSGDSIYINPYQATYLPLAGSQAQIDYSANAFTDSSTLSIFTYYADSAALQSPSNVAWSTLDTLDMVTARLKFGTRTNYFFEPYKYHHKLYVSLQNLSAEVRRLTLNTNATNTNHTINTHINFGIYNPCNNTGTDKVTIASDVYLIRNTNGQYLTVPLYSATDSALWVYLEDNVDPRYIPSFHWVVEQRYTNSTVSPVRITNREFEWLTFDNVQLYNDLRPIRLRTASYFWNSDGFNVNSIATTDWANKGSNNYSFIKLEKEFKNDPLLGYTWIDPDTSVVSQYAFQYRSGIADRFIGWDGDFKKYPNTDTLVYVNYENVFDKLYFSLDTVHEDGYGGRTPYGFEPTSTTQIPDLVRLERQAYRLTYKNPFKYTCVHEFCLSPDENSYYSITKKGFFKEFLGKPVFYLRHVFKPESAKEPYFAMVQRIDSTTTSPSNTQSRDALEAYLEAEFGPQLTDIVMDRLTVNGADNFNHGLFVATFEPATSKLKMNLRADTRNTVSPFSLERDDDPIYRRFNTEKEGEANDNPDYVHFHSQEHPTQLLFENTGLIQPQYWTNFGKKNFLGIVNSNEFPNLESHSSTTIYVDTAFVNRGTGYIKPQYLLAVRPQIVEAGMGCDQFGEPTIPLDGYVEAYYLINAYDSAYNNASGTTNYDYLWRDLGWVRLVFTRAIHANDYLYILGDTDLTNADVFGKLKNGNNMFDLDKLHAYAMRADNNIHAIYLGNNLHKDCVFSFRLVERNADDFIIESETTLRDTVNGPMIAPCEGGWLKEQNGPMVITRSDEVDGMEQALIMNVFKAAEGEQATGNDAVETSNVTVVAGSGNVTILNAAGKTVTISNILGQTVANTVLASDNVTIAAPKGVVIVAIQGEDAVKTLVK